MYSSFLSKPPYSTWQKDILRDYCQFGTRPTVDGRRELKCAPEIEAKFYEAARDFDGLGRILRCSAPLLIMFGARGDSVGAVLSGKVAQQLNARTRDRCSRRGPFYADGNPGLRRESGERIPDV